MLAQVIGTADLAAPPGAEGRWANCPELYTFLYTASEKVPQTRFIPKDVVGQHLGKPSLRQVKLGRGGKDVTNTPRNLS